MCSRCELECWCGLSLSTQAYPPVLNPTPAPHHGYGPPKHIHKVTCEGWIWWMVTYAANTEPLGQVLGLHPNRYVCGGSHTDLWVAGLPQGSRILQEVTSRLICCVCVLWFWHSDLQIIPYTKWSDALSQGCPHGSYKLPQTPKHPLTRLSSPLQSPLVTLLKSSNPNLFTPDPIDCILQKTTKKWPIIPP